MQMPPGSASASSRAATLTPSPIDVVLFSNHIAEVDPHSEGDALVLPRIRIAFDHLPPRSSIARSGERSEGRKPSRGTLVNEVRRGQGFRRLNETGNTGSAERF